MKLIHIITGLDTGGAEMMLFKLLSAMDRNAFGARVVSLTDIGPVGEKIRSMGIAVEALNMERGVPNPAAILRLALYLRRMKPDLVQTWMYHADLIGGTASVLAGRIPVVWGLRQAHPGLEGNKRRTILTARACAGLSFVLPEKIVCGSAAAQREHAAFGYAREKMVVIPNGFDLDRFHPDAGARQSLRQALGISEETMVIGLVARFDPQKDHLNFLKAAALLQREVPDARFLLCGEGIAPENRLISGWMEKMNLSQSCYLLGRRDDIPAVMAAMDIFSSASYGEGFPNVVGEAMACATPCVVTDVGDSAVLVGDTGRVVPARNPEALAHAWKSLIDLGRDRRRQLGFRARQRIRENFSLPVIAKRYEDFYRYTGSHLSGKRRQARHCVRNRRF